MGLKANIVKKRTITEQKKLFPAPIFSEKKILTDRLENKSKIHKSREVLMIIVTEREKTLARKAVYRALKSGKITRPELCEDCGKKRKLQAHHDNYQNQLDIIWLCSACHAKRDWYIKHFPYELEISR